MAVHAAFMCNLRVHLFFLGLRIDDGRTDFRSGVGGRGQGEAVLLLDNVGEDGRERRGAGGGQKLKWDTAWTLPGKNDCVEQSVLGDKFVNSAGMKMFGQADRQRDSFLSFSFLLLHDKFGYKV